MSRPATPGRRLPAAVTAVLLAAGAVVVGAAGPAQAAAYRYWSYWHVSASGSSWSFSQIGASGYRPADGSVEGWRFAVSQGTGSAPSPRTGAASAFDDVCGSTDAAAGEKRIALVLDYGTAADAPGGESPPAGVVGECVTVPTSAYSDDVLSKAGVSTRTDGSGFVCGLNGYPAHECGAVIQPATPKPSPRATATPRATAHPTARPSGTPGSRAPGAVVATPAASGEGPGQRPSPDSTARGESEPPPASSGSDPSARTAPDDSGSAEPPDPGESSETVTSSTPAAPQSSAATPSAGDVSEDSSGASAEPAPSLEVTDVADTRSSGTPWALLVAALAIAAIGGAAWWRNRGRGGP